MKLATILGISCCVAFSAAAATDHTLDDAGIATTALDSTSSFGIVKGGNDATITAANVAKSIISTPSNLSFSGGTNVAIVGTVPAGAGVIQYRLTLTTNAYLQVPSGSVVDGTTMRIEVIQNSAGTWQVSCDTNSSGGFRFAAVDMIPLSGTQNVIPCTTNATAHDVLTFWYSGSLSKWLVSYSRGYFP